MALCWSTIFWGILSLVGIIANLVSFGFHIKALSLEVLTAGIFLYTLQCICVGGCWLYAWAYPILTFITAVLTVWLSLWIYVQSTIKSSDSVTHRDADFFKKIYVL
tara:strand:+ start:152 stop:469 length:318 start_codon:yes stop_codon:yes gene_type:complete